MLKGISVKETIEVSVTGDVENPTIFLIRNLGQEENVALFTGCMNEKNQPDMKKMDIRKVFKAGVAGIKNFDKDGDGKFADYVPASEEALNAVPAIAVMDIFGKILQYNFPSGQEVKN